MSDKTVQKRWWQIGAALFTLTLVIVLAIIFIPSNNSEEKDIPDTFAISEEDQHELEVKGNEFVEVAGDFGVKSNKITPDSIYNVSYLIDTKSETYEDYITTREDAYDNLSRKIADGSPIDYDSRIPAQWDVPIESLELWTFKVDKTDSESDTSGKYTNLKGQKLKTVDVHVTFTSTVTKRVRSADDTSWDGSYNVLDKTFSNNTATITFVENNDIWQAYKITNVSNELLLATWKTPSEQYANECQHHFKKTDNLRPSNPPEGLDDE